MSSLFLVNTFCVYYLIVKGRNISEKWGGGYLVNNRLIITTLKCISHYHPKNSVRVD